MQLSKIFRAWVLPIFSFMVLLPWLTFQQAYVPSGSMIPTIEPGDRPLISKLHYGARTPQTPLQLPLMQGKIWGTQLPSYLRWIQLPIHRLPGFSSVQRGDCVVFNFPQELHLPVDQRQLYFKRCVGLPGETLAIQDTSLWINGVEHRDGIARQYYYRIKARQRLPKSFFTQHHLTRVRQLPDNTYYLLLTPARAEKLKTLPVIVEVVKRVRPRGQVNKAVAFAAKLGGNEDQLPAVYIPAQGMQVPINADTLRTYGAVIQHHEGHRDVRIEGDKLYLADKQVEHYVFQQDYYFMLGDNYGISLDSRYWGFVPADHIYGKAIAILFSTKHPSWPLLFNLVTCNLRLDRCFKKL